MQNNNSISVIIPTYNRANYLLAAVNSALNQQLPVNEILVCDDGSTDNSKDIILNLQQPIVKWIDCGRNGRPAIPRNKGLSLAKSQWVAFLDSDDEWLPNKTTEQLDLLKKTNCRAVCSNASRMVNAQKVSDYFNRPESQIGLSDLLNNNSIICSSLMADKQLLLKAGGFPEAPEYKAIEDYALWLKLSVFTNVAYTPKTLVNYRDEPSQSIRVNDARVNDQRKRVFTNLLNWLSDTKIDEKDKLLVLVNEAVKTTKSKSIRTKLWELKTHLKGLIN